MEEGDNQVSSLIHLLVSIAHPEQCWSEYGGVLMMDGKEIEFASEGPGIHNDIGFHLNIC